MKARYFFMGLAFAVLFTHAIQALTISEVEEAFKKQSGFIETIRTDFHYSETPAGVSGYEIIQRGTFLQKGSALTKIDFHFPHPQTILIRGNLAITATPDRSERTQERVASPSQNALSRSIPALIHPLAVLPDVSLKLDGKIGNLWRITATPRPQGATFGKMEFFLSGDALLPVRRTVYTLQGRLSHVADYKYEKAGEFHFPSHISALFPEEGGARMIEVRLENLRINQPLADSEFVIPF